MAAPIAFAWLLLTRLCTAGCSSLVCKAVSNAARWVEHHTPLDKFADALTKPPSGLTYDWDHIVTYIARRAARPAPQRPLLALPASHVRR